MICYELVNALICDLRSRFPFKTDIIVTIMSHVERFKVVLLGEGRVGKTSILLRYTKGEYSDRQVLSFYILMSENHLYELILFILYQVSTLQASYLDKRVAVNSNTTVQLSIWDTAGQERSDTKYKYDT